MIESPARESGRFPIAAQAHGDGQEDGGGRESSPEAGLTEQHPRFEVPEHIHQTPLLGAISSPRLLRIYCYS